MLRAMTEAIQNARTGDRNLTTEGWK